MLYNKYLKKYLNMNNLFLHCCLLFIKIYNKDGSTCVFQMAHHEESQNHS